MGDSDDEYERRRRDKFRGERSDYPPGGRDRREDTRRREEWGADNRARENWGGRESRGNNRRDFNRGEYGRPRERFSPPRHDMSPPLKRMRPDWEERRYPYEGPPNYSNYGSYGAPHEYPVPTPAPHPAPGVGVPGGGPGSRLDELGPTQPPMLSFKSFMEQCEDTISEEEALSKYSDYKLEFKRQQLNEFFVSHKEEEWFKAKYHPEECVKRHDEQLENLKRRVKVFIDLESCVRMETISVDADQSDQLLKLLDSVVIKLEGGSDLDLQVLDAPLEEDLKLPTMGGGSILGGPAIVEDNKATPFILGDDDEEEETKKEEKVEETLKMEMTEEQKELQKKAQEFLKKKDGNGEVRKKRKRSGSSSSSSSGSDEDEEEEGEEPAAPGMEAKEEPPPPGMEEGAKEDKKKEEEKKKDDDEEPTIIPDSEEPDVSMQEEEMKPKALHKTASIFLRNLAPTITKQEVEAMCRRYDGFLRAAIADPQPERRWFRRGWVTFKRDVNIKDICWNLNNIRLRDCELGAIVNRDLSRRIRTVNGITSHRGVVRADIKLAAKIIQNLDSRWALWDSRTNGQHPSLSLSSSGNPVLRNITDYLIEEASAEEEELMGGQSETSATNGDDKGDGEAIERDPTLIKVLDRLLLYLRIVHSVDYYNHSEYPNEDEMPNRCGIMHARGIPPSSKVTNQEVLDYCRTFENKIGSFLQPLTKLSDDDTKKLGLKEAEEEVEKFIQSNTQEVAREKWQCPLCGKKFKASEFVHKHILNKHSEKVKEVKKEVEYFNNYLRDPKRPQLPEYPGNKQIGARKEEPRPDYGPAYNQPPMYGYGNYGNRYPPPNYGGGGGVGGGAGGGYGGASYPKDFYAGGREPPYMREPFQRTRATYRSRVGYRDLDAPKDDY